MSSGSENYKSVYITKMSYDSVKEQKNFQRKEIDKFIAKRINIVEKKCVYCNTVTLVDMTKENMHLQCNNCGSNSFKS